MLKMICGDCVEEMKNIPDKSVDLILTDPPYNVSQENNIHTMNGNRKGLDFGEWDNDFDQTEWLNEIPRILSPNGSVIIFNRWKNLSEIDDKLEELGLVTKDIIRWEKTNPMPRNRDRRYIVDYEFAIWAVNKKSKWTFNRQDPSYQRPLFRYGVASGKNRFHPTQKPIELMEGLIKIHSNPGDTVLDPFMGSGTTGLSCINTGRNFIGIEKDFNYFTIAKERKEQLKRKDAI